MGVWKYRGCVDAYRIEVDEGGTPTRAVAEGGEEVSLPLYRIRGIDRTVAVSDGNRVFVAERSARRAEIQLRRLLGSR